MRFFSIFFEMNKRNKMKRKTGVWNYKVGRGHVDPRTPIVVVANLILNNNLQGQQGLGWIQIERALMVSFFFFLLTSFYAPTHSSSPFFRDNSEQKLPFVVSIYIFLYPQSLGTRHSVVVIHHQKPGTLWIVQGSEKGFFFTRSHTLSPQGVGWDRTYIDRFLVCVTH